MNFLLISIKEANSWIKHKKTSFTRPHHWLYEVTFCETVKWPSTWRGLWGPVVCPVVLSRIPPPSTVRPSPPGKWVMVWDCGIIRCVSYPRFVNPAAPCFAAQLKVFSFYQITWKTELDPWLELWPERKTNVQCISTCVICAASDELFSNGEQLSDNDV